MIIKPTGKLNPLGFTWILLLFIGSCNSAQKSPHLTDDDFFPGEPRGGLETLAILGTNDIHGSLAPQALMTRETQGVQPTPYEAAGGAVLASYVRILRSEFGNHFIWLDAGDEFQGSMESNLEQGAPMVQFFNATGLNAAAVGNHEFDFGLPALQSRMTEAQYPYLAANIQDQVTGAPASFPNTYAHKILTAGNLKVGIIGLSTLDTPTTTRSENVKTLRFQDLKEAALRESQILRKKGARIILLTAHVGTKCSPGHTSPGRLIRKPSDPQGECGDHDELVQLLQSLPADTIDAVVSGHTHQVIHHWIAGVPVIQGGAFGRYLNVIYLTFDWTHKKLLTDQTRIEGPVPVCSQVFQNQNDCNGDRPAPKLGRGDLVPVKFHGETVQPDSKIQSLLKPVLKKSEAEKNRVIGHAARPIEAIRMAESPLGNLFADSIRWSSQADVALVNSGGIRASLEEGPITYGALFRTMPFDNSISILKVTGQQLLLILRVAESGSRGFPSVSGLKLRLIDPKIQAPSDNLNGSGRDEAWKTNRLISASLSNGQPIQNKKIYSLATIDFLVTGGDDLAWPMSQVSPNQIQLSTGVLAREAMIQYIQAHTTMNSETQPLVDPSFPRLKFEKPPVNHLNSKKKRKHSRTKGHKRGHPKG